ncbi:MAG: hypothetical protein ABI171_16340 [Collimonas sp.]
MKLRRSKRQQKRRALFIKWTHEIQSDEALQTMLYGRFTELAVTKGMKRN